MINSLPTNFDYLNRYVDALMKTMHEPVLTGPYLVDCRECHGGSAFYSTSDEHALIDMKLEGWKELEEVCNGSGYTTYEGVCPDCLEGQKHED
jgi:hypothetical protein